MSKYQTHLGDCFEVLQSLPEKTFSACVTDPPYGLGKHPDMHKLLEVWMADEHFDNGKGFMAKDWDGFVPAPRIWKQVFRVLKPGGYLLAFAGARTMDVMGLSLRMAGFEIRDSISWIYGEGMPTGNVNVARHVEKKGGNFDDWTGYGTRLMPSNEPIILARRPVEGTLADNVMKYGTGALHIRAARIPREDIENLYIPAVEKNYDYNLPQFQKSKIVGSVTKECLNGGWPRNVIFDEDAMGEIPPDKQKYFYSVKVKRSEREAGCGDLPHKTPSEILGRKEGSAGLRYAAAGAARCGGARNHHPTLKPIALMRYLCKLACPEGGNIIDPFMGAGSTGIAANWEGFDFVGIEQDENYKQIADARLRHWKEEREQE